MNLQNMPLAFFPFFEKRFNYFLKENGKRNRTACNVFKGPEGGRLASDSLHTFRNLMLFIKRTKLFTEWAGSWGK
jgi:hypothetical protein